MQIFASKQEGGKNMPLISRVPRELLKRQMELLEKLEAKCADCEELKGVKPDQECIQFVHDRHYAGPTMIAYAQYTECKTYAVYMPDELSEERLGDCYYFLDLVTKYAEKDEQIIVFSQRDYDAMMRNNYSSPINVKLHV